MKSVLIACTLASTALISPKVLADIIEVDSTIKKVTVYRRGGANVTRSATVTMPAGNHQIIISGLPTLISERANILAAFDDANIKVTGIANTEVYQVDLVSVEQQQIQQQIDAQREQRQLLEDDVAANKLQIGFLENIGSGKTREGGGNGPSLTEKLNLIRDNAATLYRKRSALKKEIKAKDIEINALVKKLQQTGPAKRSYLRAIFDVSSSAPVQSNFDVTYTTLGASWTINANAKLDTVERRVNLSASANIQQATGEDWNISDLTLSTTEPETGQLPLLGSEFLSVTDKVQFDKMIPSDARLRGGRLLELSAPTPAEGLAEPAYVPPVFASTNFDAQFGIKNKMSIPSTRNTHTIFLKEFSLPVDNLPVKTAPRLNPNAFLYAISDLATWDIHLFSPIISLSRDSAFIGQQTWPDLLPNTTADLPFGVDPQISVDVTELPPNEGDSGIFGSTKREERRFLFSVTNNHADKQVVEVYDRIPVSAHEDVKVVSLRGATEPTENDLDGKTGVIKWVKTLEPGEVWEIRHEYRITYPEKLILTYRDTR